MFGHLGAKVGEQGRKMEQMTEKVGFLEAWRGEGVTQFTHEISGTPLKKLQRKGLELPPPPGGSTWKLLELLELKLWMETSKTGLRLHLGTRNMCLRARGG